MVTDNHPIRKQEQVVVGFLKRGNLPFLQSGSWFLFIVFLVLLVCQDCPAHPLDQISESERQTREFELRHAKWDGWIKESTPNYGWRCVATQIEFNVTDPESGFTKRVTAELNQPYGDTVFPVVIIVPTIEGVTALEPSVAGQLCGAGMASVIANVNETALPSEIPSWGLEDKVSGFSIRALRTLIDMLTEDDRFDPDRIGMIGLSLGGFTAGMMTSLEPDRLKAVVIGLGGGNFPHTMAYSVHSRVASLRQKRMDHLKIDDPTVYESILRDNVRFDPIYFAGPESRKRVYMVMAKKDEHVPYDVQKELYGTFQKPSSLLFEGEHVKGLLSLAFFNMGPVIEFLQSRFENKGPIGCQEWMIGQTSAMSCLVESEN